MTQLEVIRMIGDVLTEIDVAIGSLRPGDPDLTKLQDLRRLLDARQLDISRQIIEDNTERFQRAAGDLSRINNEIEDDHKDRRHGDGHRQRHAVSQRRQQFRHDRWRLHLTRPQKAECRGTRGSAVGLVVRLEGASWSTRMAGSDRLAEPMSSRIRRCQPVPAPRSARVRRRRLGPPVLRQRRQAPPAQAQSTHRVAGPPVLWRARAKISATR